MTRGPERGPVRRRLISAGVVAAVLATTLGAGDTVTYGAQARAGQDAHAQAQGRPPSQGQPQPRAVGSDEEFANLYTHTVGNIRRVLRGDEAAQQPGSGYLIRNPDANAFQSINIGRFAERDNIQGGMVRALFRRSDTYLLGFYVEHGSRQTLYTFTEGGRDMIPAEVYPHADRSRFPSPSPTATPPASKSAGAICGMPYAPCSTTTRARATEGCGTTSRRWPWLWPKGRDSR